MSVLLPPEVLAPEIASVGALALPWFNAAPTSLQALRGSVVCVDFWDYTCVNCIRTLPYLRLWHDRYAAHGLTILGVHAPEFPFAHEQRNVERGIAEFDLRYPIVLDNDYAIWRAFENQYWPAKYLIDAHGYLRYAHFGEGAYQATEVAIQTLLQQRDPAFTPPSVLSPLRETDGSGAVCYRVTPELYCGYRRGRLGNTEGFRADAEQRFVATAAREEGRLYVDGIWQCGPESLTFRSPQGDSVAGSLRVSYRAVEVNLVLHPGTNGGALEVWQDDAPLAADVAGADVAITAGQARVAVTTPRMYALIKNPTYGEHTLELRTTTPGLAAYAFTFVSCCVQS
ncbi:MAG: redoxin domain-containing protein [Deltaproteobacteria bacterium]|nr:redoxin domain-containing protein [Deltaproteobacteria bacterium]